MPKPQKINISNLFIFPGRGFAFLLYMGFTVYGLLLYSCSKNKADESKVVSKLIMDAKAGNPNCTCQPVINQYRWGLKLIYIKNCNGPYCNCVSFFYDENGKEFYPGTNTINILQDARLIKNIWTCP